MGSANCVGSEGVMNSHCRQVDTGRAKQSPTLRGDERLQPHGRGTGRGPHQAGAALAVRCGAKVHRLLGQEESPERPVSWPGRQGLNCVFAGGVEALGLRT